ncbi:MAG: sigma 54-interacting transcriptional regulator, partial [Betaproteobacteria bacterium]
MPAACEVLWLDPVERLDNAVRARLGEAGLSVVVVSTLDELNAMLRRVQLVVVRLFEDGGLLAEVRRLIADNMLDLPVVCRTDRGALELAVSAIRNGAKHVLAADDWNVNSWAQVQSLIVPVKTQPQTFVFADPVSQKLLVLAQRVAQAEVTTLLTGPTGAGKEVLARILHESSPRRTGPFVGLNCAAMPESMIEDM